MSESLVSRIWDAVFGAFPPDHPFRPGDRVVVCVAEANLRYVNGAVGPAPPGCIFIVREVDGNVVLVHDENPAWIHARHIEYVGQKAIDRLTAALETNGTGPLYLARATLWQELNQPDLALADCDEAVRQDPRDAAIYLYRGNLRLDKGDLDGAIDDFEQALRYGPLDDVRGYLCRAYVWTKKGEHAQALADLNRALRFASDDADSLMNRGQAHNALGNYPEALADFDRALELRPGAADLIMHHRACARHALRDLAGALADYDAAHRVNPSDATVLLNRAQCRHDSGDVDRALLDFDEGLRLDPTCQPAYLARGMLWLAREDYERALADFEALVALNPESADAYRLRGNVWRDQGDFPRALADHQRAAELDPKNAWNLIELTLTRMILRQPAALDSARAGLEIVDRRQEFALYSAIYGLLAARQLGNEAGERFFADKVNELGGEWPWPIARWLQSELTDAELLASARNRTEEIEARIFIGLAHVLAGRVEPASEELRKIKAQGPATHVELALLTAELARLEKK